MRYDEVISCLSADVKDKSKQYFAKRISWREQAIVYWGWPIDKRNYNPGLCYYMPAEKGRFYEVTEDDKNANDWTFDVDLEGDIRMDIGYVDVKKQLKSSGFCYAVRRGWYEEHYVLTYDMDLDIFYLSDFGCEREEWKPTVDDVEAKDWMISRYLL